jgi:hypothetical protein
MWQRRQRWEGSEVVRMEALLLHRSAACRKAVPLLLCRRLIALLPTPPSSPQNLQDGSAAEYAVEHVDSGSGALQAQAVAAAGCATTPVVDSCAAGGPAAVTIRLRCLSGTAPCRVRVAVYLSACPGGAQPQVVAVNGDNATAAAPQRATQAGEQPGGPPLPAPVAAPTSSSDSDSMLGGVSATTWIIVGVSAAAVLALGGLWRQQGRRAAECAQLLLHASN